MRKVMTLAISAVLMSAAGAADAAEIQVKMLNRGAEGVMVFEPALVKIEPGDTVKFVSTDKGHNAESIKGMMPSDATPFVGKNGVQTIYHHLNTMPAPPIQINPAIPEVVSDLCVWMLAKNPNERPQSYEDLRQAFDAIVGCE